MYQYLRGSQKRAEAKAQAEKMLKLFPHDPEIITDYMIANYLSGVYATADSVADSLQASDSTSSYAHLIKGLISERNGAVDQAVQHYDRLVTLAPEQREVATIKQRLNVLREKVPASR